jgi:hypothetical protein
MNISHVDDVGDVGCIWPYDIYPMIFPLTGYESSWFFPMLAILQSP